MPGADRQPTNWTIGAYLGLAQYACPKVPHDSFEEAEAHRRRLEREGADWSHRGALHSYLCHKCDKWHVGHEREEIREKLPAEVTMTVTHGKERR